MSETTSTELVLPFSGEIIDVTDWRQCADALAQIRERNSIHREITDILTRTIAEEAGRQGTKTLHLEDGRKAVVKTDSTEYDGPAIMEGLAAAGCPPERIAEIVKETVEYKVSGTEAKRAAGASAAYATVIDEHSREVEKPPYVYVTRS